MTSGPESRLPEIAEHVKVRPGSLVIGEGPSEVKKQSKAEKIREGILNETLDLLIKAKEMTAEAIEQFALLEVPVHKNLPYIMDQQIEQVREHRKATA